MENKLIVSSSPHVRTNKDSISPLTFLEWIKDPDDNKLFKKFLNKKVP